MRYNILKKCAIFLKSEWKFKKIIMQIQVKFMLHQNKKLTQRNKTRSLNNEMLFFSGLYLDDQYEFSLLTYFLFVCFKLSCQTLYIIYGRNVNLNIKRIYVCWHDPVSFLECKKIFSCFELKLCPIIWVLYDVEQCSSTAIKILFIFNYITLN